MSSSSMGAGLPLSAANEAVATIASPRAGSLGHLFDLRFHRVTTAAVVPVMYVLFIVADIAAALLIAFTAEMWSLGARLAVVALFAIAALVWFRIVLEAVLALHRLEANTRR
jgi:hypothetical protein